MSTTKKEYTPQWTAEFIYPERGESGSFEEPVKIVYHLNTCGIYVNSISHEKDFLAPKFMKL